MNEERFNYFLNIIIDKLLFIVPLFTLPEKIKFLSTLIKTLKLIKKDYEDELTYHTDSKISSR